jgi:hypothetical protein
MAAPTFNLTNAEAQRNQYIIYVDVSQQSGAWSATVAEWEPQGWKTEDAATELNPEVSTITDILGINHTDVESMQPAMSLAPNTIRPLNNYGKLNTILLDITRRKAYPEFSQFKVMQVFGFIGTAGTGPFDADVHDKCTITPQSIGGSSRVDFPYDINFGGELKSGTVDKLFPDPTFTPAV